MQQLQIHSAIKPFHGYKVNLNFKVNLTNEIMAKKGVTTSSQW